MRKVAFIGDPHVKVSNISEMKDLISHIDSTSKDRGVDTLVFLGDMFDTHDIVRISVLKFWHEQLTKLCKKYKVIVLVGNHDVKNQKSDCPDENPMLSFNIKNLTIVSGPYTQDGVLFCPYFHDHNALIEICNNTDCKTLVAHQTFTGAQYDNGFYAEDGLDPKLIRQDFIISGHIHKKSQVGKCFYVGTAKWESANDANEDKGFHIANLNDGQFTDWEFVSSEGIVTSIKRLIFKEGDDIEIPKSKKVKFYIELIGPNAWIIKAKKSIKGTCHIKARPTDRNLKVDRINENVGAISYLDSFNLVNNVSKDQVVSFLRSIQCQI